MAVGDDIQTWQGWAANSARARHGGMRVRLSAIPGLTDRKLVKGPLDIPFWFQCAPLESFRIEYGFSHTDFDTLRAGQLSRKGGRQLRQVSFDTLFVWDANWAAPWGGDNGRQPAGPDKMPVEGVATAKRRLRKICESGEPIHMIVSHEEASFPWSAGNTGTVAEDAIAELDMYCTLRSFGIEERAGEPDARYVNVSFVEYRNPTVGERKEGQRRKPDKRDKFPIAHKITADTSLMSLARHYYGDPTAWRVIAEENGLRTFGQSTPIADSRKYKVGSKITVPKPPPKHHG